MCKSLPNTMNIEKWKEGYILVNRTYLWVCMVCLGDGRCVDRKEKREERHAKLKRKKKGTKNKAFFM